MLTRPVACSSRLFDDARRPLLGALAGCVLTACSALAPGPAVPIADEPPVVSDATTATDDGGPIPAGPSLNGCAQTSFVDRSTTDADRTLYFGGAGTAGPFSFSPPCMVVSAGQTVTWTGDFSAHPLSPGTNPDMTTSGTAGSPIKEHTNASGTYAVTFPSAGTFPFFCENHYMAGMHGAIRVR